jgi:hypothetical protein
MDFKTYETLIKRSVAECGYDSFYPSLCVSENGGDALDVLEMELHPDGDKEAALDWVSQFTSERQKLFCAYRVGNRTIEVVEVAGFTVTYKSHIYVRSSD